MGIKYSNCCVEVELLYKCKIIECTEQMCLNAMKSAVNIMNASNITYVRCFDDNMSIVNIINMIPDKYKTDIIYIEWLRYIEIHDKTARDILLDKIKCLNTEIMYIYIDTCTRYFVYKINKMKKMNISNMRKYNLNIEHIKKIMMNEIKLIEEVAFKLNIVVDTKKYFGFVDDFINQ